MSILKKENEGTSKILACKFVFITFVFVKKDA